MHVCLLILTIILAIIIQNVVEYWLYQSKGKAKINPDRIARLERIGFEWNPQKAKWESLVTRLYVTNACYWRVCARFVMFLLCLLIAVVRSSVLGTFSLNTFLFVQYPTGKPFKRVRDIV